MAQSYSIEYVESPSGRCRVEEFIDALDADTQAKIGMHFELLEEFGLELASSGYLKKVDKKYGIWELRVIHGGKWYRPLLVSRPNRRIIIVHIFQKKTNRIPQRELETARRIAGRV